MEIDFENDLHKEMGNESRKTYNAEPFIQI